MTAPLYLTPADQGRRLTVEEFFSADLQGGSRYELIQGKLEVWPFPSLGHETYRDWLESHLKGFAAQHPEVINYVIGPARVIIGEAEGSPTAPAPDIACYQGFPRHLPVSELHWHDVQPILVVEILAEETAEKDLQRNLPIYFQVPSIEEYWILDPRQGAANLTMLVYRRRGQRWARVQTVPQGGTYTTPLLPGFSLVMTYQAG
jgi:Uma2 family endonuclease